MSNDALHNRFGAERIDDRQVAEVIGIAQGIIADVAVSQAEVEYLQKWLAARAHVTGMTLNISREVVLSGLWRVTRCQKRRSTWQQTTRRQPTP